MLTNIKLVYTYDIANLIRIIFTILKSGVVMPHREIKNDKRVRIFSKLDL